ncbi:LysR family transcriptional regulator [Streptomyces sp. SID3343]|uniref:LysR substrate-binding domain-containing protein n=1 Tax=Streptomyces sp. SID3343 TaxID=2690260 RepID=UPI00136EB030|nr:LysR family transcriptional regulator [Streptomyces sp. SID3343]MYV99610.1 LysR family transcriptional regulator [Streptomyces sp. SID3343]
MSLEFRELECFVVLSEELHFTRTAARLYTSQARVSQLLRRLEARIGTRLFDRNSRRVRLTAQGERFLAELRPGYDDVTRAVERARARARGVEGVLRVGFVGTPYGTLLDLVGDFRDRHPHARADLVELRLSDPFGPLLRGEIDAAFVTLPVTHPELDNGETIASDPFVLGVSARHPFAGRASIDAEELAECAFVEIAQPAPASWRAQQSPTVTPGGRPIPRGPEASTLQEALSLIAADRAALLFCAQFAQYNGRPDVVFVPVAGLAASRVTLAWRSGHDTNLLRLFTAGAGLLPVSA